VAKCWLGRLIGSGEIVRNPSLKSDRDRRRRVTALQGEIAGADQMAHRAVADPNRQAPQLPARPRRRVSASPGKVSESWSMCSVGLRATLQRQSFRLGCSAPAPERQQRLWRRRGFLAASVRSSHGVGVPISPAEHLIKSMRQPF